MTDIAAVDPVVPANPIVTDVELALQEFAAILRILPIPALSRFELTVRAALGGVHAIAQATGLEPATGAQQQFVSHVTQGEPNSPVLS